MHLVANEIAHLFAKRPRDIVGHIDVLIFFLSYSLGWLRQEENQYIDVPGEIARTLDKQVRDLVGYRMHLGIGYADTSVRASRGEKS